MFNSLVAFEGMDCAGKTTQAQLLKEWLYRIIEHGDEGYYPALLKSERFSNSLSNRVRHIIDTAPANAYTEALLFGVELSQENMEIEQLAHDEDTLIEYLITDRTELSLIAYQGGGRGLSDYHIDSVLSGIYRPLLGYITALTILLDIPAPMVRERVLKRGNADRTEMESVEFFARVRHKYLEAASKHGQVCVVDATKSVEEVHAEIVAVIEGRLNIDQNPPQSIVLPGA